MDGYIYMLFDERLSSLYDMTDKYTIKISQRLSMEYIQLNVICCRIEMLKIVGTQMIIVNHINK